MWQVILTVGLQLLGFVLEKMGASKELKEQFFKFVKQSGADFSSTKLMEYGDAQLKWLKEHPWQETT